MASLPGRYGALEVRASTLTPALRRGAIVTDRPPAASRPNRSLKNPISTTSMGGNRRRWISSRASAAGELTRRPRAERRLLLQLILAQPTLEPHEQQVAVRTGGQCYVYRPTMANRRRQVTRDMHVPAHTARAAMCMRKANRVGYVVGRRDNQYEIRGEANESFRDQRKIKVVPNHLPQTILTPYKIRRIRWESTLFLTKSKNCRV